MNHKNAGEHASRRLQRKALVKMGRVAWLPLALFLLTCLPGCRKADADTLTIEAVRRMADEKGTQLTWSDFARYPSVETGSGLYMQVYEIDADYRLIIGGMPNEAPMYIYLASTKDDARRIDVRYDDMDDFLNRAE